ncbi:MAG: hypothetical protein MJ186_00805 [Clostridia bacterium]|nr:hypothetical protein [Clostridia bacterium]
MHSSKQDSLFMQSDKAVFLGLDVGTTSVKAGFIWEDGRGIAQESVEYPTYPLGHSRVEQKAEDWWTAAKTAIKKLSEKYPEEAALLKGVSASSQAPAMLPVGKDGKPVHNALIWMDRRAEAECRYMEQTAGDYIKSTVCNRIDPYYALPKLIWFKNSHPQEYKDTEVFLQVNGWIAYMLTGVYSIDESSAALTQTLDVNAMATDSKIFEIMGLDMDKWPKVYKCSEIAGYVTEKAAEELGIPAGIPVAAGCIDGSSTPLGLGLTEAGDVYEMSGQSSGIGVVLDKPVYHPNLCLLRHAYGDKWILKGSMSCSGGSLKWFRDNVDNKIYSYDEYNAMAEKSPAGANGVVFLPYLCGERAPQWNSSLKGIFWGIGTDTTKEDMVRAVMEGCAFALRTILDEFKDETLHTRPILGTGGGYNSRIWSQIKSDILNAVITVHRETFDSALTGNALLAMMAAGYEIPEFPEAEDDIAYRPDPKLRDFYEARYALYLKIFEANKDLFKESEAINCLQE